MSYKKHNPDYKESEAGFPSVQIPESEKGDKYHIAWLKGMYSNYIHNKTALPFEFRDDIDSLRAYGAGDQPVEIYLKESLKSATSSSSSSTDSSLSQSKEWLRSGKNNIDLRIISVAPKVKSMIKAYLGNIREDVVVDTIDPKSGAKKEEEKYKTMFRAKEKKFINKYKMAMGIEPEVEEFEPENMNELDMFEQAGGFKLYEAMNMEKLVKYSLDISGYEQDLEQDIYDDLMDIGIACTKKKLDPSDNKFKDEYVDVKYLVIPKSKFNDYRDIGWSGHVNFYTIEQLRVYMPSLSEDDFKDMASSAAGMYGNSADFEGANTKTNYGNWGYNNWKVAVMEGEWIDQETQEAVFYDNKNGKTSKLPVTEETLRGLGPRKRHVKSNLQKLRQGSWVIGTEYIFDHGLSNMQDRPSRNKVVSNYHIMSVGGTPLIRQMRPVLDELMISYIRWQDARANAVKDGYAINLSKLKAIGTGGDKMSVWEVLKLWKERGLLLYQESLTGEYKGGKTLPIDKLPSSLIDEATEFAAVWDHALKMMEDITGINALILGAAPDPNAPVTTQKLSVASSANAIKPLGIAMSSIKRKSAQSFMRRFVLACKARKDIIKSYEGIIGERGIKTLMEATKSMVDYGMEFNPRPTDAEKASLLEAAKFSLQNNREGLPGINLQTYMQVEADLYAGVNLKYIRFHIGYMEKKALREDQERKERMINLQADRNDRSAQIANQGAAQQKQMETQSSAMLQSQKSNSELTKELVSKDPDVAEEVARKMGLKGYGNTVSDSPNNPK